jgi:hypothetical protein
VASIALAVYADAPVSATIHTSRATTDFCEAGFGNFPEKVTGFWFVSKKRFKSSLGKDLAFA